MNRSQTLQPLQIRRLRQGPGIVKVEDVLRLERFGVYAANLTRLA